MSPRKITDTDKFEIARLYRQDGETTLSLANSYGVSNSTISRILKNTIPEAEYDVLIQHKRGSKSGIPMVSVPELETAFEMESEQSEGESPTSNTLSASIDQIELSLNSADEHPVVAIDAKESINEDLATQTRRVRRRSSAPESDLSDRSIEIFDSPPLAIVEELIPDLDLPSAASETLITSPIPRTPVLRSLRPKQPEDRIDLDLPIPTLEISTQEDEEEEDDNNENVSVLAEMFGEEIADGEEEEFEGEEDEFDSEEDESTAIEQPIDRDQLLTDDRLHIRVKPLSQATLPRTCYIVIDKFAELIVRPLKDFAELGQIPGEETGQRTLPVFNNPRLAKRFSNQRTQRVIKVPDNRVFEKTSQHLRLKGITRLLVDGNIYSLN